MRLMSRTRLFQAATSLTIMLGCTRAPDQKSSVADTPKAVATAAATTDPMNCDVPDFVRARYQKLNKSVTSQFHASHRNVCIKEWNDYQKLEKCNAGNCKDEYDSKAFITPADSLVIWKAEDFETERLVAEIEIEADYDDLNLQANHNDLYLQYHPNAPERLKWTARMTPSTSNRPLRVVRPPAEQCCTNADDYPAVARWDLDNGFKNQTIGLKCGDGWCEIGRNVHYVNTHAGNDRTHRVKGWFDEQRLAVKSSDKLVPWRHNAAAVFPVKDLRNYDTDAVFDTGWIKVATIESFGTYDRLKFKNNANIESEVYLRHVSATGEWFANVSTFDLDGKPSQALFTVEKTPHPGEEIPGVARWGWEDTDETIWVRCPNGCCQLKTYQNMLDPLEAAGPNNMCSAGKPCALKLAARAPQKKQR